MYKPRTPVAVVVAMSKEARAIGNNDKLLWHLPEDLQRFKSLTLNKPIIMGRKTFDSIIGYLGKPLPNRHTILVTRDQSYTYDHPNVTVAYSLDTALEIADAQATDEIHIGGGAELYRQLLPIVTRLYVTLVDDEPQADTFFPAFETDFVVDTTSEPQEENGIKYTRVNYKRK